MISGVFTVDVIFDNSCSKRFNFSSVPDIIYSTFRWALLIIQSLKLVGSKAGFFFAVNSFIAFLPTAFSSRLQHLTLVTTIEISGHYLIKLRQILSTFFHYQFQLLSFSLSRHMV